MIKVIWFAKFDEGFEADRKFELGLEIGDTRRGQSFLEGGGRADAFGRQKY